MGFAILLAINIFLIGLVAHFSFCEPSFKGRDIFDSGDFISKVNESS
jgi:hypothetical protein